MTLTYIDRSSKKKRQRRKKEERKEKGRERGGEGKEKEYLVYRKHPGKGHCELSGRRYGKRSREGGKSGKGKICLGKLSQNKTWAPSSKVPSFWNSQ